MASSTSSPATPISAPRQMQTQMRLLGRRQMVNLAFTSSSEPEEEEEEGGGEEHTLQLHTQQPRLKSSLFVRTRRHLLLLASCSSSSALAFLSSNPIPNYRYLSAFALGDPSSLKIEDVTPQILPFGALFPAERIVQLFETNTYSVVNIFDVTLQPQLKITGVVEVPEGNGSGVVWDNLGHMVTNYHVVGSALSRNPKPGDVVARVNILASQGVQKSFEGKLIGADRAKDLAVLKVDAPLKILKPIKVGKSSDLKVGQQCLAIGNPFGFDHTLTVGVISGLNRDIFSQTGVTIGGGVQTDAAINPGNSGGPLIDSKGNMIGINTAIFTQTGTSAGVGFAVPSSTVQKVVPQLIELGRVVRAGLDVEIAPDLIANQLNVRNGALVLLVPGNSQAAKAGLLPTKRGFAGNIVLGDIITAVDNKPIRSKADLLKTLDDYNVGDSVKTETAARGSGCGDQCGFRRDQIMTCRVVLVCTACGACIKKSFFHV